MADNLTDDDAEEVIRQFAEITDTDEAFSHFMLQDDNFDLERALTRYYSSQDPEAVYRQFRIDNGDNSDAEKDAAGEGQQQTSNNEVDRENVGEGPPNEATKAKQPPKKRARQADTDKEFPAELNMVSWNVDGQDERGREKRFLAVLYVIAKTNPEVIFLQEMVKALIPRLNDLMLPMYNVIVSDPDALYFCVTLVSKNINLTDTDIIPFSNTQMGRSMTVIQCRWQRLHLALINTHLESLREYTEIRKAQYKQCLDKMVSLTASNPTETFVIFGGDLNIRDNEAESVKPTTPLAIRDAWEAAGSDANTRFTWDMCRNDNYKNNGRARCRFDRVYFAGPYEDVEFKLEGTSRIRGPDLFASDHFAIICRFMSPRNNEGGKSAISNKDPTTMEV